MNHVTVLEVKFDFAGVTHVIFPVVLSDEREVVLVDCGYPGFLPLIKSAAEAKGIDIGRLTKIIITHHDYDHMEALAELTRAYPHIQVVASTDDEPYISGRAKSLRLQQAEAIYDNLPENEKDNARKFQQMLEAVEHVKVDIAVNDKDTFPWCGGIEIVSTPGHMPGHISIYVKDSKTLISGDALVVENGNLAIANPAYTLDIVKAKHSIKKLLTYDIDRIIGYHGGIYTNRIKESLQNLI